MMRSLLFVPGDDTKNEPQNRGPTAKRKLLRGRFSMRIRQVGFALATGVLVLLSVWKSPSYAEPECNVRDGAKCTVTAGAGKDQLGVYRNGATYCEGSWGATECARPDGTSRCAPAQIWIFSEPISKVSGSWLNAVTAFHNGNPHVAAAIYGGPKRISGILTLLDGIRR